jgi:enediyne biosynthesis protein E4
MRHRSTILRRCGYSLLLLSWLGAMPGTGAGSKAAGNPRPPTPPIPAGPTDWFEDVTGKAGISFVQQFCHERIANIMLSSGAGGAVFDYDNDGWVDIFLLNWGPLEGVTDPARCREREPNRLYRNRGDGTFEDVTLRAGLAGTGFGSAATAGDYDNDGFTDLYVANFGVNQLYRNRGDGTFEEIAASAGVDHPGAGISAVWLDADRDGWLDLYVANYLTYQPEAESEQNPGAYPGPLAYPGEPDVFYRNRGDGSFEDATRAAGLWAPRDRAMSISAFDCDLDGDTDIYVSNDDTPNALWLNDGQGRFTNVAMESGVAFNSIGDASGSMNAAIADVDGDGLPDLYITRLGYGSLYVRTPSGYYDDRMWASGLGLLTQKLVGWGGAFLDLDNDTDADLCIVNGSAFVLTGSETLLLENDGSGRFTEAGKAGGAFFQTPIDGRGNAVLDFDNDGRLDLLMTLLADRPVLLHNRHPLDHRWLKLQLEGTRSNRSGYGALITLTAGDRVQRGQAMCPTGFLMQGDARVHFGLGQASRVDRLEILWPSGTRQVLEDLPVDQILKVREPEL